MTFNSVEFFVFFPLVLLGYALLFRFKRARTLLLLVASYVFYMAWNWRYAGLILFSTSVDYLVGRVMVNRERKTTRRILLFTSVAVNLGLLGYFKYHNFFVDSIGSLLALAGFTPELEPLRHSWLLPVGISFYTFQSLSYTIDLYRREIDVERDFVKFALYVAFFPQLVAGPIVRASSFLPQLRRGPVVTPERQRSGYALVFRGLFKKIVVADLLAALGVDAVFADPSAFSSVTLALALYGYSFQIYNDFSGYSDIAIGLARILGFDLPENFNRPYLAQNVREFWTRWHISLSTWLRDYLYIPLGGNRGGRLRVARNLMLTMLLGGLWHGAATNFVLWGGWHGVLLILARRLPRRYTDSSPGAVFRRRFLCFHLIVISWLLFRVSTMDQLLAYLNGLASIDASLEVSPLFVVILAFAASVHFVPRAYVDDALRRFSESPLLLQGATYAGLIMLFAGLSFGSPVFIYFQF